MAGCGSGSGYGGSSSNASATTSAPAGSGAVAVKATGSLGMVLVDGQGHTLYMFQRDTAGMSNCTGACASNWPPAGGTPKPGSGVAKAGLKSIKRPDGTRQLAYAGHPLYRFSGDTAAGDTNGEGQNAFGGSWYAVTASGTAAKQAASSSGGGGGSDYSGGGY